MVAASAAATTASSPEARKPLKADLVQAAPMPMLPILLQGAGGSLVGMPNLGADAGGWTYRDEYLKGMLEVPGKSVQVR